MAIQTVKLELLRGGPAHNQLLSPLTPYLGLCGAEGPVTVNVPFEHAQLRTRLERLRYAIDGNQVAQAQRQAEVHELGKAIGAILGSVPGLLTELSRSRGGHGDLVHLRLAATSQELALVPFELAIGADGFPGCGSPLFLQSIAPIALTREVRRGRPLPVQWDRAPKLLFAFASPEGLPAVPAQTHLEALRRAIDPWIEWHPDQQERVAAVKRHLTILPDVSLRQLRQACEENAYTHVHILAHGALDESSERYCLALRSNGGDARVDLVDGAALLSALTARDSSGSMRSRPTVVSLATCDSGNPGSVVTAGGSLAHALHLGGVPWVFASQFPLWMRGSSIAVEVLFKGLLRGDDPRWVSWALRQRLATEAAATHDWASIVVYAETPPNFDQQLEAFRNRQAGKRINLKFDRAEQLAGRPEAQAPLYAEIRDDVAKWLAALPSDAKSTERAERLGMVAAAEKRIGGLMAAAKNCPDAMRCYERACDYYERALNADPVNHWVVTQYLAMKAVLLHASGPSALARDYGPSWIAVREISIWALRTAQGEARAWALGTLAELELLGVVYDPQFDRQRASAEIVRKCRELCEVVDKDSFHVDSTRRQFRRYQNEWNSTLWNALAQAALDVFPRDALRFSSVYLGPTPRDSPGAANDGSRQPIAGSGE